MKLFNILWEVLRRTKTVTVNVYIFNIRQLLRWDCRKGV